MNVKYVFYIIQIQVMGDVLFCHTISKEAAERKVKEIMEQGYKQFEGNAARSVSADKIIRVTYFKKTI